MTAVCRLFNRGAPAAGSTCRSPLPLLHSLVGQTSDLALHAVPQQPLLRATSTDSAKRQRLTLHLVPRCPCSSASQPAPSLALSTSPSLEQAPSRLGRWRSRPRPRSAPTTRVRQLLPHGPQVHPGEGNRGCARCPRVAPCVAVAFAHVSVAACGRLLHLEPSSSVQLSAEAADSSKPVALLYGDAWAGKEVSGTATQYLTRIRPGEEPDPRVPRLCCFLSRHGWMGRSRVPVDAARGLRRPMHSLDMH